MTVHISARIAWHDSGWNGHICRDPKANTYCVGQYSFPGEMIAEGKGGRSFKDNLDYGNGGGCLLGLGGAQGT